MLSPLAVRCAPAPTALQPGSNEGTSDSLVGNQSWTFAAKPGPFEVDVAEGRVPTNALPGAPFAVVLHINPFKNVRVTFAKRPGGYVYKGTVLKPVQLRLEVIPPNSPLVREASEYTVEASGSIVYSAGIDPIIGTYTGPNGLGAVRFQKGGTVVASNGETGTWTVFDPALHVYTVVVGQTRWSVKLSPGQGLDDAANGNIDFQIVH
jgi:hypothetical protein